MTAVTAVTVEIRIARAVTAVIIVPAERATCRGRVTARHGGHGGHGVSRRPTGWAIPSAGCPAEAGQRRTTYFPQGGRAGKIKK